MISLRPQAVAVGAFGGTLIARWLLGSSMVAGAIGAMLGAALLLYVVSKDGD
jgi:hypothetical protein